ncbi:hypothetical protein R0J91_14595, partial [Micrococcus sp. SIMBA_131]
HVILEMSEEVARRARRAGKAGRTISLGISYSKEEGGGGFHRSRSITSPTAITLEVYHVCLQLFEEFYERKTVRKISITLSNICNDEEVQLDLFNAARPKQR